MGKLTVSKYYVAAVRYNNSASGLYHFRVPEELKVEVDDYVVVNSNRGFGIAVVEKVIENNFKNAAEVNKATAWVIDRIDLTAHLKRQSDAEKREYIINQLERKKEAMQDTLIYEALAERDPEAKKLLEELRGLPVSDDDLDSDDNDYEEN